MTEVGVFTPRKKSKKRISCSVKGCKSSFQKNVNLTFHTFPKENSRCIYKKHFSGALEEIDRLKAWKEALKIMVEVNPNMKVCSLHFRKEDYISPDIPSQKRHLKSTAIPLCNLPWSSIEPSDSETTEIDKERRSKIKHCQNDSSEKSVLYHSKNKSILENIDQDKRNHYCIKDEMIVDESNIQPEIRLSIDVGVQVKSDYSRHSFTMFIENNKGLSTATGIETLEILDTIVDIAERYSQNNHRFSDSNINLRERIIMTYVKLKQNISDSFLALIFNCDTMEHCQQIFHETLLLLSLCLKFAITWPKKKEISVNLPKCVENLGNILVILDCAEISMKHSKKIGYQTSTYSHSKDCNTCKIMIGTTLSGKISFISKPCSGRLTDDNIFKQSNILSLLEPGDGVMVDKGFLNIDEHCEKNHIKCIRPSLMKEKKQFSKIEASLAAKIAEARVHIERTNQSIKLFKIIDAAMPVNLALQLQDIFTVICATVNLSSSIIKEEKYMKT